VLHDGAAAAHVTGGRELIELDLACCLGEYVRQPGRDESAQV